MWVGLRSRSVVVSLVLSVAVASCGSNDGADTAVSTSEVDPAGERVYDPALDGEDRAALVSEWAQRSGLLTGEEVVAALGESTAVVVDAESPEVAREEDPWGVGFLSPFPDDAFAPDAGVIYVVRREGDGRDVFIEMNGPTTSSGVLRTHRQHRACQARTRPPTPMIVEFIDTNRAVFGVESICRSLRVAPSTYYAAKRRQRQPSARAVSDARWLPILMALWVANRKVYGAHKLLVCRGFGVVG